MNESNIETHDSPVMIRNKAIKWICGIAILVVLALTNPNTEKHRDCIADRIRAFSISRQGYYSHLLPARHSDTSRIAFEIAKELENDMTLQISDAFNDPERMASLAGARIDTTNLLFLSVGKYRFDQRPITIGILGQVIFLGS